jgi:hypothetical protein
MLTMACAQGRGIGWLMLDSCNVRRICTIGTALSLSIILRHKLLRAPEALRYGTAAHFNQCQILLQQKCPLLRLVLYFVATETSNSDKIR